MKNFDDHRQARAKSEDDRTFQIGGEVFVAKQGVKPEEFAGYDKLETDTPILETLQVVDELLVALIEDRDGAHERYRAIRARSDDPITLDDLLELTQWLVETQTGRPTGQPSASAPGQTTTGTTSTDASSSQGIRAA